MSPSAAYLVVGCVLSQWSATLAIRENDFSLYPDLIQVLPQELKHLADGSRNVFVAFVNPTLPASMHFHSSLHSINRHFNGSSEVLVRYADCGAHPALLRSAGVLSLPTLRFYAQRFPRNAIEVAFAGNRTAESYIYEVEERIALSRGINHLPVSAQHAANSILRDLRSHESVRVKEFKAARSAAAQAHAIVQPDGNQSLDANATQQIGGEQVVAAVDQEITFANHSAVDFAALEATVRAHTAHLRKLVEIQVLQAEKLLTVVDEMRQDGSHKLARRLNDRRQQLLMGHAFLKPEVQEEMLVELGILEALAPSVVTG